MKSALLAIAILSTLMVGWALVQAAWRRLFADQISDEDVLAERRSCGQCGCTSTCSNQQSNRPKKHDLWHA